MTLINAYFYFNAIIILLAAALALIASNAVHGLLYFIVSIIALAVNFYLLDAPLASALEIMVYAGAIMVLFVFVVMLLNIKYHEKQKSLRRFVGPSILALILVGEFIFVTMTPLQSFNNQIITLKDVAISLFVNYNIGIEIASLILLAALVGAFHLGKKRSSS